MKTKRSWRGLPLDENGMDRVDRKIAKQSVNRKRQREGLEPVHGREAYTSKESQHQTDLRLLQAEVTQLKKEVLSQAVVREQIIRVSHAKPPIPSWTTDPPRKSKATAGCPTLFLSDLHWGECVRPTEIGGVNEYDIATARTRLRTVVHNTISLLREHIVSPGGFPGIVLCLGGDMLSGDIHEELTATNELPVLPSLVDLYGALIWVIDTLADEFGQVFLPCVSGNHSRLTRKPQAKSRNFTNLDWLLYQLLDRHFQGDTRVTIYIPDSADAAFRIYGHRYLLTHGDQFRGGDGLIGFLGPVTRGDHKKRSRNAQIGADYDTLLIGHWHQLVQMQRVIANGSLKGYDEYAYANNFGFEEPRQALWITHPERGITFQMPVQAEKRKPQSQSEWVSVPKLRRIA